MKSKLRLRFYPYTYARVSVMKGMLLDKMQWQSLLKMGPHEVLRTLQDSDYQKEINELGVEKHDMPLFERALNGNLARMLTKLYRICDERLQQVLDVYLMRYDMANIKAVLRGKTAGVASEEIVPLLLPSVHHPADYFTSLMTKETVHEIVAALPFLLDAAQTAPLLDIETALDRWYFDQLFLLTQRLAGEGSALREFISAELDITNIKIILRLVRIGTLRSEKLTPKTIKKHLIHAREEVSLLAECSDVRMIVRSLSSLGFIHLTESVPVSEEELLTQIEIDLDTSLLKKEVRLMYKYPLSVNVILGFMFAKEIEVRNLKVLLKGKHLGLDEQMLARLVVV